MDGQKLYARTTVGHGLSGVRTLTAAAAMLALVGLCGCTSKSDQSGAPVGATSGAAGQAGSDVWWKHGVLYEIYPRSFQDSNGDGIGDLNGITQRMEYLKTLGVDAMWISPMYPSPQVDFGYDISNYEAVDPQYGTMADFDKLVAAGKQQNIRVILDMVLNHTSDKHAWFVESASSRTNAKADWYMWQDPKGYDAKGKPIVPNNWISGFGGSAWQWVPARKQFYYHEFYKQQPDLNWRDPAVEKAMFDSMRFWLDRGVAGFRLDAIPNLFEDPQLRDNPVSPGLNAQGDPNTGDLYTNNLPEVHDVIRRMRTMVDSYPDNRVLIGETYLHNVAELNAWYGGDKQDELQLPMDMQVGFTNKLDVSLMRQRINDAETQLGKNQPLFVFDNHDNARSWDRYGDGVHNEAIAKVLATVLLTSRSTALMYYGEELGMKTSVPTRKADVKDPIGITGWPKEKGRDGERTPMQWDASKDAGFSTAAKTWLPVASDYKTVNVKAEEAAPDSLLQWHEKLIAMRRGNPALRDGTMTMLDEGNTAVLSFVRKGVGGGPAVVSATNFTGQAQTVSLQVPGMSVGSVTTLLTDAPSLQGNTNLKSMVLPPFASWVGSVQ